MADLALPGTRGFRFRQDSALFLGFVLRTAEGVAGFVDSCPHAGWPLAAMDDRYLNRAGSRLVCSGHGALFDFKGLCIAGPGSGERLAPWPVTVRDGEVFTA